MRLLGRSVLVLLSALSPLVGQNAEPANPPDGWARRELRLFALNLPEAWREITVDEVIDLGEQLPFMMRDVQPGRYYAVGDVDRWIDEGFDGLALLVVVTQSELTASPWPSPASWACGP